MLNLKAKTTIYDRFGVENIRQCEEYANICRPDKSSEVYKRFEQLINAKARVATEWLAARDIEYTWNERINNHLYRLYIPDKDLLLDFEYYPVSNMNYNYIRINYDTNMITILERLFPEVVLNTEELDVWKITQKAANRFLKANGHLPIYNKNILRIALVKDEIIYQCIIIQGNKVLANVTRRNCMVKYGTYILLRYLTEVFSISEILIKENSDNSYTSMMYQLMNLNIQSKTSKKKIWWNSSQTKWHIDQSEISDYMPFYFTEKVIYCYRAQ